jgi:ABC-type antimicrobial peptide transport system permease subunit
MRPVPKSIESWRRANAWIVATLALVAAGVMASLIPAVRATRVDPVIAIRTG